MVARTCLNVSSIDGITLSISKIQTLSFRAVHHKIWRHTAHHRLSRRWAVQRTVRFANRWCFKQLTTVHNTPPVVPILSHMNPDHDRPDYLKSTLILSPYLRIALLSCLFPSCFPQQPVCVYLLPLTCYILRPFHPTLTQTNIICWIPSLCSFLHSITPCQTQTSSSVP